MAGDDAGPAGVTLAGGYSRRFGRRDKVLADLDGKPLFVHALLGLAPAVDGTVISCRGEQVPEIRGALDEYGLTGSVALATDPVKDQQEAGPLVGLMTALSVVSTGYVVVVGADNPLVDTRFLRHLYRKARGRHAAVPQVGGDTRPLQAVYRTDDAREAVRDAIESGGTDLRAALHRLAPVVVPQEEVFEHADRRTFVDVDTRRDLELARSSLESDAGEG